MLTHCTLADYNGTLNGNTVRTTILLLVTKQLGEYKTLSTLTLFLTKPFSSICVGYLTHRLVHFRIRVNGPEDNTRTLLYM